MTPREREIARLLERNLSNNESALSAGQEGGMTSECARDLCRLIAYHEAGHAVVARKLGLRIVDIEMTPSDGRVASVQTRSALWVAKQAGGDQAALARGLYADLMVVLAGEAAETLAGYPENPECEGDFDNSINCAWHLARIEAGLPIEPSPDEPQELYPGDPLHTAGLTIIERAKAETKVMLKDNWQTVMRVAGLLATHDRLSQAELDHVIFHG